METTFEKAGAFRDDLPDFRPGDTVVIEYKVVEGGKERIQPFQGTVIRRRGRAAGETFTVRRVLHGVGVERIFPMQSPLIKSIKVIRKGRVRRSKLYYLRRAKGRKARIKEALKTSVSARAKTAGDIAGKAE